MQKKAPIEQSQSSIYFYNKSVFNSSIGQVYRSIKKGGTSLTKQLINLTKVPAETRC